MGKQPGRVGDGMRSTCADDMSKMGLEVISFTIKEVRDKNEYITNMGKPDVARIKRDADVATAEADRDTAIKRALAQREAAVAKAQADQERVLAETLDSGIVFLHGHDFSEVPAAELLVLAIQ